MKEYIYTMGGTYPYKLDYFPSNKMSIVKHNDIYDKFVFGVETYHYLDHLTYESGTLSFKYRKFSKQELEFIRDLLKSEDRDNFLIVKTIIENKNN